jgi:hypothetical protein
MEVLNVAVQALLMPNISCQIFATVFLSNLSSDIASHTLMINEGVIRPLINLMHLDSTSSEARRYAASTLANFSISYANHEIIIREEGLEALLILSNSPDTFSQKYVACTLANFASNSDVHSHILRKGLIQSLTFLAYNSDFDVRLHVCSALRGLSIKPAFRTQMVREGCLDILLPQLSSNDVVLLREVTACMYHLSLNIENKYEIPQNGFIQSLIRLLQDKDLEVSNNSCACLSNLAQISCNQAVIASEGGVHASIIMMRSAFVDTQRRSSYLLSLLCACNERRLVNEIMANGGHRLLISYLKSCDEYCQYSGVLGILNLSAYKDHRVNIAKAQALGPLLSLITSDDTNLELRKMTMMSILNLSDEVNIHAIIIREGVLNVMISLWNSLADDMRMWAALTVANVSKNVAMREIVTDHGGLESVLDLARNDITQYRRNVLGAIASLSFVKRNKGQICFHGGIKVILQGLRAEAEDKISLNLACCAIANLSEHPDINSFFAKLNLVPLLTNVLTRNDTCNEAIRALGNLATQAGSCVQILQDNGVIDKVQKILKSDKEFSLRMVYMMITNLTANIETHRHFMRFDIIGFIVNHMKNALNPKFKISSETTSYILLFVANLSANDKNHEMIMEKFLGKDGCYVSIVAGCSF